MEGNREIKVPSVEVMTTTPKGVNISISACAASRVPYGRMAALKLRPISLTETRDSDMGNFKMRDILAR